MNAILENMKKEDEKRDATSTAREVYKAYRRLALAILDKEDGERIDNLCIARAKNANA